MNREFAELYVDALKGINLEAGNKITDCLGVELSRLETISSKMSDVVKEELKEGDEGVRININRSRLYQKVLYECEPTSVMEVYLVGILLGQNEENDFGYKKQNRVGLPADEALAFMMTWNAFKATIIHYSDNPKVKEEFDEYTKMLNNTLFKNIKGSLGDMLRDLGLGDNE
jgi:hypothetical protein